MNRQQYFWIPLSLDDIEWTRHWLPAGLRTDFVLVGLARGPAAVPSVVIQVIESKATAKTEDVSLDASDPTIKEAVDQAAATLDLLWSIYDPQAAGVLEDVRFASFIEHIASLLLHEIHPVLPAETEKLNAMQVLSAFSRRNDIPIDWQGLVVVTQYGAGVHSAARRLQVTGKVRPWNVTVCRTGVGALRSLLAGERPTPIVVGAEMSAPVVAAEPKNSGIEEVSVGLSAAPREDDGAPPSSRAASRLAEQLLALCKARGFRTEEIAEGSVTVGPTLISASISLQVAESARPIELALDDLARELGVPSLEMDNDPDRQFHVRFLIARKDREFPVAPVEAPPLVAPNGEDYGGLNVGADLLGRPFLSYLSSWPHSLVGGTTGSGKTTFLRSLIRQATQHSARSLRVVVVDGKGETDYIGLVPPAHFVSEFPDVQLGAGAVLGVFEWLAETELPRRRRIAVERARAAANQNPWSARTEFIGAVAADKEPPIPVLLVVVDEFAQLMLQGDSDVFARYVQQVAQVGRSSLVHLILATQRPDAKIVSGAIKANLSTRVALRLPTAADSLTILGRGGAEKLLGRGDLLFETSSDPVVRLQGYRT